MSTKRFLLQTQIEKGHTFKTIYVWTPQLAVKPDMKECDEKGVVIMPGPAPEVDQYGVVVDPNGPKTEEDLQKLLTDAEQAKRKAADPNEQAAAAPRVKPEDFRGKWLTDEELEGLKSLKAKPEISIQSELVKVGSQMVIDDFEDGVLLYKKCRGRAEAKMAKEKEKAAKAVAE